MAVSIQIQNVMKKYEDNVVITDLTANIQSGELFTLLGPSGCGKTTLLRMIAGFNTIEHGTISFDNTVINNIPVYKRNFGMVFQNYAIFPNMTVYKNVEYGLKNKKLPKAEIKRRIDEILDAVQITQYKDRYPNKLSGGQQQRVALARAIVVQPQVLLMDEPLSNLDAKLRLEMRTVIREIQNKIGITTVYVTHDQEEALAISDRIAIMNRGDIHQIEVPERIYSRPYDTFVAGFIGHSNQFRGTVAEFANGTAAIRLETGLVIRVDGIGEARKDQEVIVSVRPEEFHVCPEDTGLKGTVRMTQFLGKYINYEIDFGTGSLIEVSADTNTAERIYSVGERIDMQLNVRRINVFDQGTGITMMKGVVSNVG